MGAIAVVVFFHFYIMSEGIKETTASHSAWILTVAPLVTVLLAWLWLKERPTWRHWIGMLIASLGVILLDNTPAVLSSSAVTSRGNLLVLATCWTWAVYTILMKRLTATVSPLVGTFWVTSIAALIFAPFALSQGMIDHAATWSTGVIWHLVYLGVGCLALAFWFWSEGLRLHSTAESSVFLYIEPLITVFVAWILLGEIPTGWLWIGALAIALGVQLAESKPKEKRA
jgi:drug/metabolite transporter (DMT)-like permease